MPSIAEATPSPFLSNGSGNGSAKKRRWEGEAGTIFTDKMSGLSSQQKREIISPLRHYGSAGSGNTSGSPEIQMKRAMMMDRAKHDVKRHRVPFPSPASPPSYPQDQTITIHSDPEPTHAMDIDLDLECMDEAISLPPNREPHEKALERVEEGSVNGTIALDLRPCHICRRKPTARHELAQFAGCECCSQRTCGVCIRRCLQPSLVLSHPSSQLHTPESTIQRHKIGEKSGPVVHFSTNGLLEEDLLDYVPLRAAAERERGERELERLEEKRGERHRDVVCARCCRERGGEGEVWCLGCLEGVIKR